MRLYVVSGLGAGYKVLERLEFSGNIDVKFLPWIIPDKNEDFYHYVQRMAEKIDDREDFYLLGYSFGGIMVQEINKLKPARKVVILGSIKSDKEKSNLIKSGEMMRIPQILPTQFFGDSTIRLYMRIRKRINSKNLRALRYFQMKDPYYLKWSLEKICEWKFDENPDVIQILGDKDIVFPIKNSNPDFIIKNGTHLFPATKSREVSELLKKVFS